jgi:hypothetical protein
LEPPDRRVARIPDERLDPERSEVDPFEVDRFEVDPFEVDRFEVARFGVDRVRVARLVVAGLAGDPLAVGLVDADLVVAASNRSIRDSSSLSSSLEGSAICSTCLATRSLTSLSKLALASADHSMNPAAKPDSCSATPWARDLNAAATSSVP